MAFGLFPGCESCGLCTFSCLWMLWLLHTFLSVKSTPLPWLWNALSLNYSLRMKYMVSSLPCCRNIVSLFSLLFFASIVVTFLFPGRLTLRNRFILFSLILYSLSFWHESISDEEFSDHKMDPKVTKAFYANELNHMQTCAPDPNLLWCVSQVSVTFF